MTAEIDGWLTAVRLRRLPEALAAIRSHPPPGVPEQRVNRVVWNRCDGPLDDVQQLVDALIGAGLLEPGGSFVRLTAHGRRVATQDHQHGGRLLARSLIDAGYFRNQARRLLAFGELSVGGDLVCRRATAVGAAAQLTGVLRLWSEVTLGSHLSVPADLVRELLATWSLQPIPRSPNVGIRREVGDRAEAYSFRWEQANAADPSHVQWVALDDASLGYDIRNAESSPERCIEVKGSQGSDARFFLSSNEWTVGQKLGDSYEIHFWGSISLTRPRLEEYDTLKRAGYPLVFRNLCKAIDSGDLLASPSQYLVTAGRSSRARDRIVESATRSSIKSAHENPLDPSPRQIELGEPRPR